MLMKRFRNAGSILLLFEEIFLEQKKFTSLRKCMFLLSFFKNHEKLLQKFIMNFLKNKNFRVN